MSAMWLRFECSTVDRMPSLETLTDLKKYKRSGFEVATHVVFDIQMILRVKSPRMETYLMNVFEYVMDSLP